MHFSKALMPAESTLWGVICESSWVVFWYYLKLATGYVGSGAFWEGLSFWSLSMIYRWLLLFLGLEVLGRG